MPVAPATIVRTNRSCRDIHHREPASVRELEWRVPRSIEIPRRCSSGNRSVSLPVSARTSHVFPWSMCPAVPTVSGVTDPFALWPTPRRRRPRRSRPRRECGSRGACGRRGRPRSPAVAQTERLGEALFDCAGCARQLGERQRPAAHARDTLLDLTADERREPFRPSTNLLDRLVEHPEHRNPISGRRIECDGERSLERSERACRRAARAEAGGGEGAPPARLARRRSPPAVRRGACLPRSRRHPPPHGGSRRRRLVANRGERARAEVVDEREPACFATSAQLLETRALGEADDPEVRLVHPEQRRRLGPDRRS